MVLLNTALSSVRFARRCRLAPSTRSFATTVIGRSQYPLIHTTQPLKPTSCSEKVGEENRKKRAGTWATAQPEALAAASDEEGSTIDAPTKAQTSCGACRTRQSDIWWKAPKGLPTSILCDNCGQNWRKYADLNVRPVREDVPVAPQGKAKSLERGAEKREGTPLSTAPAAKRLRVSGIELPQALHLNPSIGVADPGVGSNILFCNDCTQDTAI